jgi:hypothetical protein
VPKDLELKTKDQLAIDNVKMIGAALRHMIESFAEPSRQGSTYTYTTTFRLEGEETVLIYGTSLSEVKQN